jgi:DNA modification methylase
MAFHHFQPHIDATNSPAHTPRMAKKISVAKTSSEVGTDRRAVPARASQSLAGGSEMPLVKKGNAPAGTAQRAVPTKNLPRPSDGRGSKGEGRGVRPSSLLDTRVVYCGDNLEQLAKLPDACVDLIYIDPPFNSNRNYEVFWGETTKAYIDYMRPRCVQLARVLKQTGSFYYHCDDNASHYVKVMLDQIFGENNFQNEIIWQRARAHNDAKRWPILTDSIFFYTGGDEFTWNPLFRAQTEEDIEKRYRYEDESGRRYRLGPIDSPNPRPNMMYEWKGFKCPAKGWRYSRETMAMLDAEGKIHYPSDKSKRPAVKLFLEESKGALVGNIWTDIGPLQASSMERLGYPTQKPLPLLERIVQASSNENDIVLDAFCGCGTALVAAQKLKRQWIGIDISPTACRVMAKRLRDVCGLPESEPLWRAGRGFVVRDLPWTVEKLRVIPPFEFENWAVIALGGIPNKVQVGDMGVDGRIFPVSSSAAPRKQQEGELGLKERWYPIQVKQKDKVGRPDIDAFEAMMMREDCEKGFFVSFDYSSDALQEIESFFKRSHKVIVALTVQEILDEHIAKKLV